MRKLLLVVVLVVFGAAPTLAQDWFRGSLSEARIKAKAEGKVVLIDFGSPG